MDPARLCPTEEDPMSSRTSTMKADRANRLLPAFSGSLARLGALLMLAACSSGTIPTLGTFDTEAQVLERNAATRIGILYGLWHCPAADTIYTASLADGPRGAFHWWGRPQLGYYC